MHEDGSRIQHGRERGESGEISRREAKKAFKGMRRGRRSEMSGRKEERSISDIRGGFLCAI